MFQGIDQTASDTIAKAMEDMGAWNARKKVDNAEVKKPTSNNSQEKNGNHQNMDGLNVTHTGHGM